VTYASDLHYLYRLLHGPSSQVGRQQLSAWVEGDGGRFALIVVSAQHAIAQHWTKLRLMA